MNAPSAFVVAALEVIEIALNLYMWILIVGAIMSWLVAFGVINTHNRVVQSMSDMIYRITEPALRPIRRVLPPMGGVDLSPLVLIFIIIFLQRFIAHLAF
jgi:YggT family protein